MNWYLQSGKDSDVVTSTRIRFARNLQGFKFNLKNQKDIEELKNKINNQETFFLVMGFPKCSWCQNLMGPLNDVAKEENIEVIYYLDIKEIRDNTFAKGHKDFEKLSNTVFKEVLIKKTKKINSPTTMKIESGVLTKYHVGTVDSHLPNERGVLEPLTTTQKEELFIILKDLLSQS